MATQEKLYTITALKSEKKQVEQILKDFRKDIVDSDKTKVFKVQGLLMINYTVVCSEETFSEIVKAMNGSRIY